MRKTILLLMITAISIFGGCSQSGSDTIKIGAILPLTGTGAEDGEFQQHGIDLAVKTVNDAGGINGKPLEVVYEDSQNQAKTGIGALNTIMQRYNPPVVISTMSGVSAPLAAYVGGKVPTVLFVTVASVPNITRYGDNIFRSFVTRDVESRIIAQFMFKKGFRKIAILYVNDDYGLGGKDEFSKEFKNLGGTIAITEAYEKGSTNHRNLIAKVMSNKPDGIFIVGYDKSFALLVKQLGELPEKVQLATTSPLSVPSWRKLAGPSANGVYLANSLFHSDPDDPETRAFDAAYRAAYGRPSNYLSAAAYTSVMMIANAIKTDGYSKDGVQKGLSKIKDMPTLLGKISMTPEREAPYPVRIAHIVDGKVVNLK